MTRILIVDDEETIRLALRKFLRSRGYEVEIAGSGEQAMQVLDNGSFSLMLCDVRMPGMTGVQLVPRARDAVWHLHVAGTQVNVAARIALTVAAGQGTRLDVVEEHRSQNLIAPSCLLPVLLIAIEPERCVNA